MEIQKTQVSLIYFPCWSVFVPSRLAVAGALTKSLMDGSSSDNRGLKKIMKRHIIKGEFTQEDLRSMDHVTTIDGERLEIHTDENGAALIGGAVSIEMADMLASNGIAHIVDDFIVDNLTTGMLLARVYRVILQVYRFNLPQDT